MAALAKVVPLLSYFEIDRDEFPIAQIFLMRAGLKEAALLSYGIADFRCRDYWQAAYWSGREAAFDPSGKYDGIAKLAEDWKKEHTQFQMEAPSVAFRRALHRYYFHMLKRKNRMLPLEATGAIAVATLDAGDPQKIKPRIDAMVAGNKIDAKPKANATLAERLMAWGEMDPDEMHDFRVTSSNDKGSVGISTAFAVPVAAYTPDTKDLAALFALLDDRRPTRWFDYQGPRTLGENALRAIAAIFEKNPLEQIGAANLEPWTEAKRKKATVDLQDWWQKHAAEYKKEKPAAEK
ncbi:MAG: hypothetical protein HY291_05435 [Planctomycetes bacterium]|nr:hypothetical protein [Planctomycetota bacterium]